MPQATLSARRLFAGLPTAPSAERLEELLFASKAELADWTDDALRIEATADRLDLLTESGLALALAPALGGATGLPHLEEDLARRGVAIEVDASVAPLRPEIAGAVVVAPAEHPLDDGLLDEAVRFQELLHATLGADRRLASLGFYALDRMTPPLRYRAERIDGLRFTPLDAEAPTTGPEFFASHPMALQYGRWGRDGETCLTFRDARGEFLSLPPILNARPVGEARPGDRALLLESTGRLRARVVDALGMLLLPFVAHGWRVAPVAVRGPAEDDGRALVRPRTLPLTEATLRAVGGTGLSAVEVEAALGRARLSARSAPGGWEVSVPPWRPDLLGEVDVVEDLLLARGLAPESGLLPAASTLGRRRAASRFRDRVGELLLGLGFVPLTTTVMVASADVTALDRTDAIAVANPVSELYSHLRDRLQIPLVAAVAHNTRHSYPQRFSEVGAVVVRDRAAESGTRTVEHAGAVLAGEGAGFAEVAALVDYLLGALGVLGVRETASLAGTIPGRAARVRLAGETVAEIGEIAPGALAHGSIPVPVAWLELDLTALAPLLARDR